MALTEHELTWSLGDRLRKARRAAEMTQAEIAAALEVSTARYGNWESDTAKPRDLLGTLEKVAKITGAPLWWLLGLNYQNDFGDYPWDSAGDDGSPRLRPVVGTVLAELLTNDGTEFGHGFGPGSMN